MKIPKSIEIKGERWIIIRKTREQLQAMTEFGLEPGESLNGYTDFENKVICIGSDIIGKELVNTLIHELGHAVLHMCHVSLDRALEEIIVDALASDISKRFNVSFK
jgi:Zn-dependent peptidase ImmA (M78 family)